MFLAHWYMVTVLFLDLDLSLSLGYLWFYELILRRYNEETKFSVTPSFVLTHSSDSIELIL